MVLSKQAAPLTCPAPVHLQQQQQQQQLSQGGFLQGRPSYQFTRPGPHWVGSRQQQQQQQQDAACDLRRSLAAQSMPVGAVAGSGIVRSSGSSMLGLWAPGGSTPARGGVQQHQWGGIFAAMEALVGHPFFGQSGRNLAARSVPAARRQPAAAATGRAVTAAAAAAVAAATAAAAAAVAPQGSRVLPPPPLCASPCRCPQPPSRRVRCPVVRRLAVVDDMALAADERVVPDGRSAADPGRPRRPADVDGRTVSWSAGAAASACLASAADWAAGVL